MGTLPIITFIMFGLGILMMIFSKPKPGIMGTSKMELFGLILFVMSLASMVLQIIAYAIDNINITWG